MEPIASQLYYVDSGKQPKQLSHQTGDHPSGPPFSYLPVPPFPLAVSHSSLAPEDKSPPPDQGVEANVSQDSGSKQGTKQGTRIEQACHPCGRKKRRCDGGIPCSMCLDSDIICWYTERAPPKRAPTKPVLDLKDEFEKVHCRLEAIEAATSAFKDYDPDGLESTVRPTVRLKRKHSISTTFPSERTATTSAPSTTHVTEGQCLTHVSDSQRYLVRHDLCQPPKDHSASEQKHYCESSFTVLGGSEPDILVIHAFIPGRTLINDHVFGKLLRQHDTVTHKIMIPALMTLYLEQVKERFETAKRRIIDIAIIESQVTLWKLDRESRLDDLYFTLLANQYVIIRPRLKSLWTRVMVPWLCSDRVQRTLQRYGDLGLRLKINSHWVFSDVACGLYLGQPKSFLSEGEEVLDEIDPLVGLSPRLLNIYANVTGKLAEAKSHLVDGTGLRDGLQGLRQYIPHLEGLMGRKRTILENVASAYLHGAHLYILCRQERRPVSDPTVQQHRDKLRQLLEPDVLPLSGHFFRAVWPLLPAFILCVTCSDPEERHVLREGLIQDLHKSGSYSNIPNVLDAITKTWYSKELELLKEGWWEDMVAIVGPDRISLT